MSDIDSKPLRLRLPKWSSIRPQFGIAQKIGIVFFALLLVAAVNVVLVERLMQKSDIVADTVNVAGKLRMLGQRIALQSMSYGHGVGPGSSEIRQLMRDFESALAALTDGGYVFGLYIDGLPASHRMQLQSLEEQWAVYRRSVYAVLEEVNRYRDTSGASPETAFTLPGNLLLMMEEMTGQSARLLERAEALMAGIVAEVEAEQESVMGRMYLLMLIDAFLIFLGFIAIRRQIVTPLRELSTHCVELAAGNYNTRFEVNTHDEIGHLAKVFNASARKIGALVKRIEEDKYELERAESMFRGIAENSMVGVYIAHKGRFRYVNLKMAEIFGYGRNEMLETVDSSIVFPGQDHASEPGSRQRLMGDVPGLWVERKGRRKDGSLIEVEIFGSLMTLGNELVTIGIALDITRRKEVEAQAKLAMLVHHNTSEGMVVTDASGQLLDVNPAFTKITGYTPEEVIGKRLNILSSGRHDAEFYRAMWEEIQRTGCWEGDIWNRRKNGEIYAERLVVNTSFDDDGSPRYRIGLFSDITKQKEADAFIWKQANYDHLTGLPNRQLFHSRLEKEMERSNTIGRSLALVYLDLDDFKDINDTLGHGAGDKLLIEAGRRLQSCIRSTDTVARLGGDEFVLILGGLVDAETVNRICRVAMERLVEPFDIDGERATISASMGVTFYPADGDSVKELLQNADLAMYAAKARGKQRMAFFEPAMQAQAARRRSLTQDLARALKDEDFVLFYQPIVRLETGAIEKAESLIRWQHPDRGMISPVDFIPFAEDTGLIKPIGDWVFRAAATQIAQWRREHPGLQVSVNVSPLQFLGKEMDPREWVQHLSTLGLEGRQMVVEITERLLMDADESVSAKLKVLREAGVEIALDDFGTGYSSMSYLKYFHIDYLKIDRGFVQNLAPGSDDLVLCEAMIGMAHRLGLEVVAEGVETRQQRDLLREAGCDFAQGYLFSPPVGAEAFSVLLRVGHIATPDTQSMQSSSTGRLDPRT